MRTSAERQRVERLVADGLNDCAVARATGIPRSTVREWRASGRRKPRALTELGRISGPDYAYLLGIYLGDGHIARIGRTFALRVYLDSRYPVIIHEVAEAMQSVFPEKRARRSLHRSAAMVELQMYSNRWPALLPQHGPGKKHERPIVLAPWQQEIVDAHHEEFLRGLIHSDGCRHINRVWRNGKAYEYSRYAFTNASSDIRALFCSSCDALGIAWRRMNARNISVARREAVAALDAFVGPKA